MNGGQAVPPSVPASHHKSRGRFVRFLRSLGLTCSGLVLLSLLVSIGIAPRRSGPTTGLLARVVDGLSARFEGLRGRFHARPGYAPVADYDDDQFDM